MIICPHMPESPFLHFLLMDVGGLQCTENRKDVNGHQIIDVLMTYKDRGGLDTD